MSDKDREVDADSADPMKAKERRRLFYRIGSTAGKQFRKGGPGREVAKRVGSAVVRRGLWRFLR
jgi:hypothetical protein